MIGKLEARIAEKGGTPEEWTMLARAHKYLGQNDLAAKAFTVALENDANNAQLMLEAAEVIALNNNREFTPESRALVLKAYSLEPENANVLWFIGVAEFQQGNYRQSIEHLKKLLPQTRGEEDVLKSIVSIVAKSRQQLILAGEDVPPLEELLGVPEMAAADSAASVAASAAARTSARTAEKPAPDSSVTASAAPVSKLTVSVDINSQVREKFSADDTIFVYAKAKQGPRMPLAVQRLALSALPATVTLDDSMAMVEGMNLSSFEQLQISARVTKTGSAIAQSGDYIGQVDVNNSDKETIKIIIETVVP
jgi:cytochrome c-type biogenesis protein CcmH